MEVVFVGVLLVTAQRLRAGVRFVPVGDAGPKNPPSTLHDLLVEACGCHRGAGPLGYWEHEEVTAVLDRARTLLASRLGSDPGAWSDLPGRTALSVAELCERSAQLGDVDPPSSVTLRPWCRPTPVFTCRVPYVTLAAVLHFWQTHPGPVAEVADALGLADGPDAWELLSRAEVSSPRLAGDPTEVARLARVLRARVLAAEPAVLTPTQLLLDALAHDPELRLADLESWAARR